MQVNTFIERVKSFFTRKRIIWTVVILVVIFGGYLLFGKKNTGSNIQTGTVAREDIQKTVLTTGQVVSETDLSLSFQANGVVRSVRVKEGDQVYAGQILATLDQGSLLASLESARGSLAQAQANYDKIRGAATTQDIAVSQAAVDIAKTTLENAKQNLVNQLSTAYNNANIAVLSATNNLFSNSQSNNPQFGVSGTVQTNTQAVSDLNNLRVNINVMLSTWQSEIASITDSNTDQVVSDTEKNLTTIGTYLSNIITILTSYTQSSSSGGQTAMTSAQTAVTSAKATIDTAYSTVTTYTQAVRSARSSLAQAEATLGLKQAPARPEDIGIAEAQVLSAQGQVHMAEAALNNTLIVAPISGTVTLVNIKLGEQAQPSKEAMKLLNVSELHAEASVSEADIASVVVGQTVDNTFDALGPDKHFDSKILTVNPASTVVSGVVNYKVTASLPNIPEIKPGMTANMTIKVAEKKDALVVPSSAIVNKDGKKYVKVIDDPKKKTYHQVEVSTGLEADGGLTEITSGLSVDQPVVTYIKL
ncbi:MAG: efflux RND transporter periplasmic adaptor subunit [Patescibacteria group bacterium]